MNIHFIAIGGAAMHNLALALQREGHTITGSDDEIFEPSRTRLQLAGLLPTTEGWFPDRMHAGLDAVVLGMHAKADNPERTFLSRLFYPIYLAKDTRCCGWKPRENHHHIHDYTWTSSPEHPV